MKKQLIHIHGGEAFTRYEDALSYLQNETIDDPFAEHEKGWKHTLKPLLEGSFDVALLSMPNSENAKYGEWKIWFEKVFPFLRGDVVFVGHSLGAMFLIRYFSENTAPVSILGLHLIAPAFEKRTEDIEDGGDFFAESENIPNLSKQCDAIFIYHSQDDFVVPFEDAGKFKAALPSAELVTFEDRGHFLQPEFPELIARIRKN